MTDHVLDELARRVMLDAALQEYGSLMEELPEHGFSPGFERKMRKLVCQANHPIWYRVVRTVACLILAAVLSGCAVLAISPEARGVFSGWVREVYETSFIYRFAGTEPETFGNILYRPTYVPNGWQIKETFVSAALITNFVYYNDAGEMTAFTYFPSGITPAIQVVRDEADRYKRISVNGMPAELYLDHDEGDANVLIWTDEEGAIFCIHSALNEAELVKIAESLETFPATWRPTWLPEGYEVFDETAGTAAYNTYVSEDGMIDLVVLESIKSAGIYITPDEGDVQKQVLVSGLPADLYLGTEGRTSALVWADERTGLAFTLITGPDVTEEQILKIAESVRPAPAPEQPHRPSWVPAEYVRKGKSGGMRNFELNYDKENGEQILFRYWADGFGDSLPEELEEAVSGLTPEDALVNGLEAQLYADADGVNHLVWHSGEDAYWLSAHLTDDELIKIAESVGQLPRI